MEIISQSKTVSHDLLSTEDVKNEVEWVNTNLKSPFEFKIGKPTKLGIFLTRNNRQESWQLKPERGHGRTAKIGEVIFQDTQGRLYRDIDIKGVGQAEYLGNVKGVEGIITYPTASGIMDGEVPGLLNFSSALHDAQMAEILTKLGVRTHRAIAIIALAEIVNPTSGEKMSVEQAKNRDSIVRSFVPVIEVRAFGTKVRVQDINSSTNNDEKRRWIEDAKKLIAREGGQDEEMTDFDYLKWVAKTITKDIGTMHKNGWLHNYLRTGHNITIDGRLVDLDSVRNIQEESNKRDDAEQTRRDLSLDRFAQEFMNVRIAFQNLLFDAVFQAMSTNERKSILSDFNKSYATEYPDAWERAANSYYVS